EEWFGSPVYDGKHRAGRVGADPRQALQIAARAGQDATALLDGLREAPERMRLLPPEPERSECVFEVLGERLREDRPRWVALDEPWVGPRDPCRGRPLQQDLSHNDLVRCPVWF